MRLDSRDQSVLNSCTYFKSTVTVRGEEGTAAEVHVSQGGRFRPDRRTETAANPCVSRDASEMRIALQLQLRESSPDEALLVNFCGLENLWVIHRLLVNTRSYYEREVFVPPTRKRAHSVTHSHATPAGTLYFHFAAWRRKIA